MEHRVAITGMGTVTPVGNTAQETWASLVAGVSGIGPLTRFDTMGFKVSVAAEVKGFDGAGLLGKVEAAHEDLFVQYVLVASDEAMADSGLDAADAIDHERLGVYVGSGTGGMTTLVDNVHTIAERGPRRASPFMIPMMISNMAAGSVSIRHRALGPTLPVVSACATSAHAVGEAFRAIKGGYADAILAGGSEAAIIPESIAGFTSCRALSTNPDPATACRPFDAGRDGFVMGEGACILVLEDLEHARARGAHVYAEVVGYGNTADAYHVTSPDPEAAGIARAIRLAVEEGGVRPDEGLYVNAHGTSTKLNDASETLGLKRALGEKAARAAHVSSTKSMTGHMIGATGAVEVLVCARALEEGVVPPTIGYATPDPACDLDYTPNEAVRCELTWALSTSLGFGGHNAALALRAYRER
ncbi:beta-ketoacyl-ACP synthase II [Thermophilibacter immobilis]|jgi:3-oxoacyl-[acyl-carrier-protein] synthase II|uniref:3-oxoacyl-[acyl-carrier-protein] synthase 2 n=1 Tax=Thermophilibacter immobilis TaxID=2779519 RepID=A0A7S7M828_9ACTN|nr:beta-ketoacyl-ACP synthase II [Thermophilibacter immobilis]QOY60489.1 beta-ketoacyl-ACP synthase II [Thermophilibacter immobilis]